MMFNATFNNIPAISWRLFLLVEETGVPGPAASCWQTLSHNIVVSKPRHTNMITSGAAMIVCFILPYITLYRKHSIKWNCFPEFGLLLERQGSEHDRRFSHYLHMTVMVAHVLHSMLRGGCWRFLLILYTSRQSTCITGIPVSLISHLCIAI